MRFRTAILIYALALLFGGDSDLCRSNVCDCVVSGAFGRGSQVMQSLQRLSGLNVVALCPINLGV